MLALAAAGHQVLAAARTARDLRDLASTDPECIVPLPVDYTDDSAFAAALAGHGFDQAVVYAPALSDRSRSALLDIPAGTSVDILTSAAARPSVSPEEPFELSRIGPARSPWCRLVLGWTGSPPRWHTPAEISEAAVDVLRLGEDRLLGTVRPWADRPG